MCIISYTRSASFVAIIFETFFMENVPRMGPKGRSGGGRFDDDFRVFAAKG